MLLYGGTCEACDGVMWGIVFLVFGRYQYIVNKKSSITSVSLICKFSSIHNVSDPIAYLQGGHK